MLNSLDAPLILVVAGWVTYVISTAASRLLSRSRTLLDLPNHRSSHARVTSRAGGVAICGGWFTGLLILGVFSGLSEVTFLCFSFGLLVFFAMMIGLIDDKWSMSSMWKLAGQLAVAALFTAIFSPLILVPLPITGLTEFGPLGVLVTIFWIVGFMNAYNFMDGANGLAAGSASVGLSVYAIITAFSGAPFVAAAAILLAVACFAFLPANLIRGKLFMGDSGSQSISFAIACFGVYAANETAGSVSALVIPVIFLPFIFDVAWTLGHRILRKQNILCAHREHNYQLLLQLGATHLRVALIYMGLIGFSSAAAIMMLAISPAAQWLVPFVLCGFFTVVAMRVYLTATEAGLLASSEGVTAPKLDQLHSTTE